MKISYLNNDNATNCIRTIFMIVALALLSLPMDAQEEVNVPKGQPQQLNTLLNQNKHAELQAKGNEIREQAAKNGDHVLYYYAWRYQIIDLRNQVKLYEAIQQTNAMMKEVASEKDMDKGERQKIVFMGYEVMGKIFEARGNYDSAASYLNKAIECVDDIDHNGYELSIYNALARVYRNADKYEESLAAAEKGLSLSKRNNPTSFKLLQSKAFALYYLDRKDDFMATYADMKRTYGDKENFDRLNIRKYAYEKRFGEAHRLADKTKEERERLREHLLVYQAQDNWKAAYNCEKKLVDVESSRQQAIMDKDIAELSTKYDSERLRADNYALEIENSRTIGVFLALFVVIIVGGIYAMWRAEKKHVAKLSKANKELAEARDKAEASDRMKTKFVQNISHEIRTPLNAIVGFSDLLANHELELGDEEKHEFSQTISKNTNMLTTLVNDMLELSDLQSGDAKLDLAPCSCNEMCRMAILAIDNEKSDNVEIKFLSDVDDHFSINTDNRRLNHVLTKLLSNAAKYTTEGTITMECSTTKQEDHVTFSVTDTGCGIPKNKQSQLFHSFEKIDSFQQGMGISLYLCALTAKLLNARIGIDPEYTKGARFFIAVPCR